MITSVGALFAMAATGMSANQVRMDVIADNLSNVNTTGFKSRNAQFGEALARAVLPDGEVSMGQGVQVMGVTADMTQGSLSPSDQPWHLAIEGAGFFEIRLPDGGVAYTRDGRFRVDQEGRLVTTAGYALATPINVPREADGIVVNPDGTVMAQVTVTDAENRRVTETRELGHIELVGFRNPQGLDRVGGNLYAVTDASGPALRGAANAGAVGEVIGHALEMSNISLVEEMTELVSAQRAYTVCARLMHTMDEMTRIANDMIR
jgi:flagellar basal-body rod protein FlgG